MGRWSDKEELLRLAKDLPAVWESPTTDLALKRRITRILIHEIIANGSSMAFRDGKCKSSSRDKIVANIPVGSIHEIFDHGLERYPLREANQEAAANAPRKRVHGSAEELRRKPGPIKTKGVNLVLLANE